MQGKSLVLLLSVLFGSAFLAGFNENLVNMALMSIMGEYGVDSVTVQWLVTGYMIVATVVVTCMAFLYRRFKLRALFFSAAGLSIAGSALGLVSGSFEMLLCARLVQAVGTGIFIPLMMNTILVVTPKNKLGTFMSIGGCMITFGPAFAPVVCGALVTGFGWHSIFVVPIVAMAVLAVLGFFFVKNLETSEAHLDVPSVALSAFVLTALSFGLAQLTIDALTAAVALVLAAAAAVVFVVRQLRCAHPLIDLAPFKNRAFWPALLLATVAMMSMFSMSVLLPLYFEGAAGMTALWRGWSSSCRCWRTPDPRCWAAASWTSAANGRCCRWASEASRSGSSCWRQRRPRFRSPSCSRRRSSCTWPWASSSHRRRRRACARSRRSRIRSAWRS